MPIPPEYAHAFLAALQVMRIEPLFAQQRAKHVLQEIGEEPENFPQFDPDLENKVTFAAYGLLAVGCSMIELGERNQGTRVLERASALLQSAHGPLAKEQLESSFHVLVAAMAFYAAGHYSRAFVTMRAAEGRTAAARIITAFLRKDVHSLILQLNEVLLTEPPPFDDILDLDEWAITVAIARSVAIALEFIFTGSHDSLVAAIQQLGDAAIVSADGSHPAWWWIVRLLHIMLKGLGDSSPWWVLPPYFGSGPQDALKRYIQFLAFSERPIAELWWSQRQALPLALNPANRGAVINLRTSAGKTRIAELAILQTLLADSKSRVFYLAPFRSLAFEIEQTFDAIFGKLGYEVSHLYGGSRISSIDVELAAGSDITIATPEKARALFRATPELFENVKLFVIDEGHLIGSSERDVRNEIFFDHLRCFARVSGARLLLLSAVLPNADELAEWITGDPNATVSSEWKPSAERFGLLRWNGSRVRIDWRGEFASFNPSFIEAKPLKFGRRRNPFPNNKYEAVAATAVRLSKLGPVMIFTGKAVSVPTLAKATLLALGEEPDNHQWPDHEWGIFEAICQEELDSNAIEVHAARAGVLCHSDRLTPQVRLAAERLMRAKPPRVIIATTTLAQGVNVGISSVIVATPYIGNKSKINKRDFWNICGRAGRAFVDGEGKILYAIDDTRENWQIKKDEDLARNYFDTIAVDRVESGLLFLIGQLHEIAAKAGVSFDLLLGLAADNDFSDIGDSAEECECICDLLDDELLALHVDPMLNPSDEDPVSWVERVFRDSLAAIQARSGSSEIGTSEDILSFLRARVGSALRRVPEPAIRKAIVSSGLPLSVAVRAQSDIDVFREAVNSYMQSGETLPALAAAVRKIEEWARTYAIPVVGAMPETSKLDTMREGWLGGVGLRSLSDIDDDAMLISKKLYGYQLPWIIHAASQQLRSAGETEQAAGLAKIALLVELGVPNEQAAMIFLAGVRSRVAVSELAALGIALGVGLSGLKRKLRNVTFRDALNRIVSPSTAKWLDLMAEEATSGPDPLPSFFPFSLPDWDGTDALHVRYSGEQVFLCNADGQMRIQVEATDGLPFDRVANDPRIAFERSGSIWNLTIRDPRLYRGADDVPER